MEYGLVSHLKNLVTNFSHFKKSILLVKIKKSTHTSFSENS